MKKALLGTAVVSVVIAIPVTAKTSGLTDALRLRRALLDLQNSAETFRRYYEGPNKKCTKALSHPLIATDGSALYVDDFLTKEEFDDIKSRQGDTYVFAVGMESSNVYYVTDIIEAKGIDGVIQHGDSLLRLIRELGLPRNIMSFDSGYTLEYLSESAPMSFQIDLDSHFRVHSVSLSR